MYQNEYSTTSLPLAAALALFFPVEGIDRTNPDRVAFIFKRDPQLDLTIEGFWKNTLRVSPQAYFMQIKLLKTRLYDYKNGG